MDLVCFSTESRGLVEKYGPEHGFSAKWGHFVEKLRLIPGFSMKTAGLVETLGLDGFIHEKGADSKFSRPLDIESELKLLSYDLILEGTLDILVALYACLVNSEFLSSLCYSDVLLVNLDASCYESLSELSCSN